jgi:DNA-binding IclR family transcriptional regulator
VGQIYGSWSATHLLPEVGREADAEHGAAATALLSHVPDERVKELIEDSYELVKPHAH